ncbi:MAG: hypothetical protein IPF92_06340 [Myxococcales bacterium]|jgi:hypothetical protein|nr:hypothetical protein [Myxococcales bacterium]MBL0192663.1 hypothetical protein [Myxococcales bacterium]HQY62124.1 hypothetical protein [Polyangiaceae bacterium]
MRPAARSLIRSCLALTVPLGLLVACSDPVPAIPRVIIDSQIRPGTNGQQVCGISSREWITIGNFGGVGTAPRPVETDQTEGSGTVTVACSVLAEGEGFRVNASATVSGAEAGTVSITGLFASARVPQQNITVIFSRRDFGRFEQKDCVATYDVNANAGVASGRVWAKVICPKAVSTDNGEKKCETEAQFRFENCEQAAPAAK